MKRLLAVVTVIVLPGLFAVAQEQPKEAPAAAPAPQPGAPFFEHFDLNKDGKVDWDEYQKVKSGFAALDVDRDGAITPADMTKVMEQRRQRMQQAMQQRMQRRRMHPGMRGGGGPWWGGERMGPGGFGPFDGGGWGGGGGQGQRGPGGWQGERGPMGPGQGMPPRRHGGGMGRGPGARPPEPPPDAPQPPAR